MHDGCRKFSADRTWSRLRALGRTRRRAPCVVPRSIHVGLTGTMRARLDGPPMRSIKLSLLLLALLCAAAPPMPAQARAASRETEWMQVLLEGRKIGWSKHVRTVSG